MTALAMPETNISLIFLPMFHFPISFGFAGMVGLDIMGIIRGWQYVIISLSNAIQYLTLFHSLECSTTGRTSAALWQESHITTKRLGNQSERTSGLTGRNIYHKSIRPLCYPSYR